MYKDLIQAAKILSEICDGRNIDTAFNQFIKEDNNKNFVKDIVYGSVRDFYLNDFILKKFVKNDDFLLHAGDTYFPNYSFLPKLVDLFEKNSDVSCSLLLESKKLLKEPLFH